MKKTFVAIMITGMLTGGCAQAYQDNVNTANQSFAQSVAQCNSGKLTRKNAIARIDCSNQARVSLGMAAGVPYMGLIYQYGAANKAAAAAFADGKTTENQYNAQLDQNTANYNQSVYAFQAAAQQQRTQNFSDTMQSLSNYSQQQQMIQNQQDQQMLNSLPKTTNCYQTFNGGMNCTTW